MKATANLGVRENTGACSLCPP